MTASAAVDDAEAGFFPHYRHPVTRTWGTGRVTVIGDAAHSKPPTRAQGANQALEDAWALALGLRRAGRTGAGIPATLREAERARSPKAALVARHAGTALTRLIPGSLASRYYTRWLGQVSNYLDAS